MKIKLLCDWTTYRAGQVLEMDLSSARSLIGAGVAVRCEDKKAVDEPPVNKMRDEPAKKKRGRPKGSKNKRPANTGTPRRGNV